MNNISLGIFIVIAIYKFLKKHASSKQLTTKIIMLQIMELKKFIAVAILLKGNIIITKYTWSNTKHHLKIVFF